MDDNTIKSLDFDAVCLPPDKHIPLHSQSTWELSCVITGEGTRVLGDVSERFSAGDTVLIPPATPHCWYFDSSKTDAEGNIEGTANEPSGYANSADKEFCKLQLYAQNLD